MGPILASTEYNNIQRKCVKSCSKLEVVTLWLVVNSILRIFFRDLPIEQEHV